MDDFVTATASEAHIKRERAKARELRKTPYFRNLLQQGICHYCGKRFSPEELTLDHIIPVARGGRSTKGNLVVSCRNCNRTKSCLTPAEQLLDELEKSGEL